MASDDRNGITRTGSARNYRQEKTPTASWRNQLSFPDAIARLLESL